MKKQIMKMEIPYNCSWKVIMDDSEQSDKFKIYRISNGHTKLIQKCSCIASCLQCIAEQTTGHEWQMTDRKVDRLF